MKRPDDTNTYTKASDGVGNDVLVTTKLDGSVTSEIVSNITKAITDYNTQKQSATTVIDKKIADQEYKLEMFDEAE